MIRALVFLDRDGVALFDGVRWPRPDPSGGPGAWALPGGSCPVPGRIRAYREADLPFWIDDVLWVAELDGPVEEAERLLLAARGRLVERVDSWTPRCAWDLVTACGGRVLARAIAAAGREDSPIREGSRTVESLDAIAAAARAVAARGGRAALFAALALDISRYARDAESPGAAAGTAAFIAATAAGLQDAERAERSWQASWLAERLGLAAPVTA